MNQLPPPQYEQQQDLGFMDYMRTRWAALVAVGAASVVLANSPVSEQPAYADAAQAVIGMPFDGKWAFDEVVDPPYTDANSSHPSVHAAYGFNWATDLYAAAGEDVKVYGSSPQGEVTFKRSSTSDTCSSYGANIAGQGVTFDVRVNGTKIGEVKYDHIDPENVGNDPIASGTKIGEVTSESLNSSCFSARHAHVQFKNTAGNYSCYVDKGHPGVSLKANDDLGVIGSTNTAGKEACSSIPSSSPSPRSAITSAMNPNGGVSIFVIGHDGNLYRRTQPVPNTAFNPGWYDIPASAQDVEAVQNQDGRIELLYVSTDKGIRGRTQLPDGSFSPEYNLGESFRPGIAAVRAPDGKIQVYVVGIDGNIYRRFQETPNGPFAPGWYDIPATNARDLDVTLNADGRIELVYVSEDGVVRGKSETSPGGGFGSEYTLGPNFRQDISAATNADGTISVFVVGMNGYLYRRTQATPNGIFAEGWYGITSAAKDVAALKIADTRIELSTVGADGAVWDRAQFVPNGSFGDHYSLEGDFR